jgi:hypothetical protein
VFIAELSSTKVAESARLVKKMSGLRRFIGGARGAIGLGSIAGGGDAIG